MSKVTRTCKSSVKKTEETVYTSETVDGLDDEYMAGYGYSSE